MRRSFRSMGLLFLSFMFSQALIVGAQSDKPATPPPAPATGDNPSVMLLKQGHSESVRAKAAQYLGKQGDRKTIPALAEALGDSSSKVRREVVLALAQFHLMEIFPPLEKATKDADDGVRITAVQCLVGYYSGVMPTSGFSGFVKKNWQRATSHFQPDDSKIDPDITVDATVITTLIAAMKDTHSHDASREAAKGLGILLAKAASADLITAAHSSDPDLAREALNSLAKIKDMSAGPKLVDLLDSPNKDIKRDACVTAGILRTKEALSKMQLIYQSDADQKDKAAAMEGLGYLGDKVSVPLFTQALWSDNKDIRQGAGEGLARAADPQCLGELQKAQMAEKDSSAKLAVEFALAALGKDDGVEYVVSELGSKIRGDIARAYLTELARDPAFLSKLYPYLQSPDNGIRKRLCVVLMYSGDQGSLQQLDRLAHDQDSDVANAALRAKRAIRARLDASGAKS